MQFRCQASIACELTAQHSLSSKQFKQAIQASNSSKQFKQALLDSEIAFN
jgi:hypothetical protein